MTSCGGVVEVVILLLLLWRWCCYYCCCSCGSGVVDVVVGIWDRGGMSTVNKFIILLSSNVYTAVHKYTFVKVGHIVA